MKVTAGEFEVVISIPVAKLDELKFPKAEQTGPRSKRGR